MNKKYRQSEHFSKRLRDRYGLKDTQFLKDSLLFSIRNNKAKLIKKQSNRVFIFDIDYSARQQDFVEKLQTKQELTIRVVYDKLRKNLVSALPKNFEDADNNIMECEL